VGDGERHQLLREWNDTGSECEGEGETAELGLHELFARQARAGWAVWGNEAPTLTGPERVTGTTGA